jgi:putative DNA methylase
MRKKLIEVALPLEAINTASAREKSIRHGHPSTLHLWWARRPLAAARAVIFAQMVDDPSSCPEEFPTEAERDRERQRLFRLIEELVKWGNTTNETVLEQARAEIRRSWRRTCADHTGHPRAQELFDPEKLPAFHDPFAGGGSLPLEAQRLGLEAYASDLNPVAVLINKAMIEIPPRFAGRPPVNPESRAQRTLLAREWKGAQGLAEDVRYYGKWMRDEAEKRIGHLYPKVEVTAEMAAERPDLKPYVGRKLTVIAWLWARTVKSPNPAFAHLDVPLASTFMLSTKPGKEAYVEPVILPAGCAGVSPARVDAPQTTAHPAYRFTVKVGKPKDAEAAKNGTKLSRGANFRCLMSGTPMASDHIKAEGIAGRLGARLMAIVAEGERGRVYLAPTAEHEDVARCPMPGNVPSQELPIDDTANFWCTLYGLTRYADLFTPRQLVALTTFSDLVQEARERVMRDALGARASRPQAFGDAAGRAEGVTPAAETAAHPGPHPGWHSRGYHPHFDLPGLVQSVNFRLHDSVPESLLAQWRDELRIPPGAAADDPRMQELRRRLDRYEDAGHGACHLRLPEIADLVQQALLHFDGERYRVLEWCIMPNHVHVVLEIGEGHSLQDIVHSWKSYTAKEANRLLGRTGAFWMADYYDRFVRDERHLASVRTYVRENPVKAGLCRHPEDWPWSSAGCAPGCAAVSAAGGRATTAGAGQHPRGAGETPAHPGVDSHLPLRDGGTGAAAYADAVVVYLACVVSAVSDDLSSIVTWRSGHGTGATRSTFARQALPMVWDFAEANPFASAAGDLASASHAVAQVVVMCPQIGRGRAMQADAVSSPTIDGPIVSTDPPYYDNIGYADLSDFFYVWLRRSLKPVFPDLFATLAVPKAEELVATPYRHGSKAKAEKFFLDGMTRAMHRLAEQAHRAFPITIYYAFKQAESESQGTASTGWETFLEAVIRAGLGLSGTWPMRTERGARSIGIDTNALASSIVLVCRPRPADAPATTRREFVAALRRELPEALRHLQHGNIAPVDLAQAAIGPGMAVFTRYSRILEQDGSPMPVRAALALINQALDEVLAEQEGEFETDTRCAVAWFEQHGMEEGPFGEADVLARAKNTSVSGLMEAGILLARAGRVRLLRREELPAEWDPAADARVSVWEVTQHLIRALLVDGSEEKSAAILRQVGAVGDAARDLAYRLYGICERKGWAQEAIAYNSLVVAWPVLQDLAQRLPAAPHQATLDL